MAAYTPRRVMTQAETLSEWLEEFLTAKMAAGLAPRTVEWYCDQISAYLAWLVALSPTGTCAPGLAGPSVEQFLAAERERGLSPSSVKSRYAALSAWSNWLVRRGKIDGSFVVQVEKPRVPKQQVRYVQLEEFRRLYTHIHGRTWWDYRDRCLLMLLFWSGLRLGEVAGLQVADIDAITQLVTVRRGKGGKARIVPIVPEVQSMLAGYLVQLPPLPPVIAHVGALWFSNNGAGGVRGVLTAMGVRQILRRRCKRAGVRYMNPHSFRHGFAMEFLNHGMELSAVSAAMGHSSVQVTANEYAHWLTAGLSREHAEAYARMQGKQKPQDT